MILNQLTKVKIDTGKTDRPKLQLARLTSSFAHSLIVEAAGNAAPLCPPKQREVCNLREKRRSAVFAHKISTPALASFKIKEISSRKSTMNFVDVQARIGVSSKKAIEAQIKNGQKAEFRSTRKRVSNDYQQDNLSVLNPNRLAMRISIHAGETDTE